MAAIFSNYTKSYSDMEAIMLFIIGFIVIILIISGNLLVIIAVVKDKTLKNLQNWFIGKIFLVLNNGLNYLFRNLCKIIKLFV